MKPAIIILQVESWSSKLKREVIAMQILIQACRQQQEWPFMMDQMTETGIIVEIKLQAATLPII